MAAMQTNVRTQSSDAQPPSAVSSSVASARSAPESLFDMLRVASPSSTSGGVTPAKIRSTRSAPVVADGHWQQQYEDCLATLLEQLVCHDCPPRLASAMHDALLPGGARLRPKLTVSVAAACGLDWSTHQRSCNGLHAAAVAVELLHGASLVQDDLPCFDDAALRRGVTAVHRAHGERLAILASDALIVGAFDVLAAAVTSNPQINIKLMQTFARGVGAGGGITAGQAWESETDIDMAVYHTAKTGSLFAAATAAGAVVAGHDAEQWRQVGSLLGQAYQIADDLVDARGSATQCGKPVGVDARHQRPNAVAAVGTQGATDTLMTLLQRVIKSIPPCPHPERLIAAIHAETERFLPKEAQSGAA